MYYCESRYYVPQWCRWLNGDSIGFLNTSDIHGMNLFAYSSNNSIVVSYRNETIKVISTVSNVFSPIYSYNRSVSSLIGSSSSKASKNPLSFSVGIITPENYEMNSWMSIYAFYAKGSIGPSYTVGDGFSIASFSVGVLDATFHTPKWFSSLPNNHLANPNIYLGVGTWNASASLGYGLSANAEILSGTAGMKFGDAVSMGVKGYLGTGITLDFSKGIKFGFALGYGFEISISW